MAKNLFQKHGPGSYFFNFLDVPFLLILAVASVAVSFVETFRAQTLTSNSQAMASLPKPLLNMILKSTEQLPHSFFFYEFSSTTWAWFLSLFLPAFFFAAATSFYLSTMTRNAQRLASLLLIGTFLLLCILTDSARMGAIGESAGSLQVFLGIKSILIALAVFGVVAPMILAGERKSNKIARAGMILVILMSWLFYDWKIALREREVNPDNLAPGKIQTFVLVVPEFSKFELTDILEQESLAPWSKALRSTVNFIPSSNFVLPQLVSMLTGVEVFRHGVRTDRPLVNEIRSVQLSQAWKEMVGGDEHLHIKAIGRLSDLNILSPDVNMEQCIPSVENYVREHTFEKSKLPSAVLPDAFVRWLFPISRCSQTYFSLEQLVQDALLKNTRELRSSIEKTAFWLIDPEISEEDATSKARNSTARKAILTKVLKAIEDHLTLLRLDENVRVLLIGLGGNGDELGFLSLFEGKHIPHLNINELEYIGPTDVYNLIAGKSIEEGSSFYREIIPILSNGSDGTTHFDTDAQSGFLTSPLNKNSDLIPQVSYDIEQTSIFYALRKIYCPATSDNSDDETLETLSANSYTDVSKIDESGDAIDSCLHEERIALSSAYKDDLNLQTARSVK